MTGLQIRKLALIFEAKVGSGKPLACSMALKDHENPVSCQLMHRLHQYVSSEKPKPEVNLTVEQLQALLKCLGFDLRT
jgi:hypothetical protein